VSPDGIIKTIAGIGLPGGSGNNCQGTSLNPELPKLALNAQLGIVFDLALGRDGSLFITSSCNRVYRVTSDGMLDSIAGGGPSLGDGGPATEALLDPTHDIVVDPEGSIYLGAVSQSGLGAGHRVRRIGTDGIISTVVGDGVSGSTGVNGPAAAARVSYPHGVALDSDGRLFIADLANRVLRVEPALPGFKIGTVQVPSRDGHELYEFDQTGRHLRTFDVLRLGATQPEIDNATLLTVAWTDSGLLSTTDADDNVTSIERDAQGVATAVVGPFGDRTTLDVDSAGWLTRAVDPAGGDHDFSYDPGTTSDGTGLLVTYTTPEEHTYEFGYDTEGLLIRDDDPAGGFKTLARTDAPPQDTPGWDVEVETALGRMSTYGVADTSTGTQTRTTTDPAGLVTTTTRTPAFAATTADPTGVTTISTPSADPFQKLGFTAAFEGKLDVTTPGGRHLLRDRVRTLPAAGDYTDTIRYLNPLTQAVLKSSTVAWDHDATEAWLSGAAGRRRTASFAARIFDEMMDPRGRVIGSKLGSLHPLKIGYDSNGRIASLAQGPGTGDRTTSFAYNAATGRLTSITDPASRVTTFDQYDAAGRVLAMTLPGNRTVGFSYDANGNLTSLTPPGQPAHVFRYTAIDQEEEYEPPALSGIPDPRTIYTYDLDRALDFVARPDGETVDLAYEPATGRLDTIEIAEGAYDYSYFPVTAPTNDPDGQLQSISAPGGESLAFAWDATLPLSTTWSGTVAGAVSRTFDDEFRIASETIGAATISFGYDNDNLLTSAGAETITRSPSHGLITNTGLGVVATTETPSAFAELDADAATVSGSPIYSNAYTQRDALGRITQKTETIQGTATNLTYSYTTAGQLDVVSIGGTPVRDYDYDANGNRTHVNGQLVGSYDAQDRLTSYNGVTYTYTAAGDLETKTEAGATTTYGYDALGNLRSVVFQDGRRIEYVIDGLNRRVGKKLCAAPCTGGATAQLQQGFLYADQLRVVAELDGSNQLVSRFVYGTKANVPDLMIKSGVTYRILSDHLGSPRLVVNTATGAVAQRIDYDEWGNATVVSGPADFQPFGFAGGIADRDTGLVRFGARDYDARVGRWTSKDPIGFGAGVNLFSYGLDDPVNLIDSNGLAERTPSRGVPNSSQTFPDGRGGETTRHFGPDGRATKDVDSGHDHGAGDPHVHDWDWTGDKPIRQGGRPPEEGECPRQNLCEENPVLCLAGGLGGGYGAYRLIRMVPSMFPPLWWTIPVNAAAP
jgi:RHS repeat-associated protein